MTFLFFYFSFFRTSLHSGVDNDDDDNGDDEDDDSSDSSLWPPFHPGLPLYIHQDSGLSTDDYVPSTPLPNGHGNMVGYDILF